MEKFSVKKPFTILVAVIMVLLLGFVSITNMQTNLLPDISTPYLMVVTVYPGASPERVESEVSDVMENALGTVSGVESITATSAENYSLLLMKFAEGTDMNSAMVKTSNKVDQTATGLPSTCLTPSIIEYSLNMNAFMTVAVSREGSDVYDLSDFVDNTLVPYVGRTSGVSSVSANGLIEKMVQVQLNQDKIDEVNARLLELIDTQLADARVRLDAAEAQIAAGRAEYEKQLKNFGNTVSDTVMAQMGTEVADAVTVVRDQAQALLNSVNQLIGVVNEPEIQQALIDVRDGLQRVVDQFNQTGMRDIDSLIEIVGELRDITDKLTAALQELQGRLGTSDGTVSDLANELEVSNSLSTIYKTLDEVIKAMDNVPGLMNQFSVALGSYSSQQLSAYMQFTEAREKLKDYENQLEDAKQLYEETKEKALASADVAKQLDIKTLAQLIYAQNFSMPAGYVADKSGESWLLKVGEEYDSVSDIVGALLLHVDGFGDVRLSDVADVAVIDNAEASYTRLNGERAVVLKIFRNANSSASSVSDGCLKAFKELQAQYSDLHVVVLSNQGNYITIIVNSIISSMLVGAALAIIVLAIFLKDIKPTLVVGVSIPLSVLFAVVLMYFTGLDMNIMTLAGLSLGVGMLVDNSIVVIENIYRMRNEEGASAKEAAIEGARQVGGAIMASTLTTVCVFLPIVFTSGITRQLFVDMGLTIAYSLLASLAVALTLVPMMSAGLLKKTEDKESKIFAKIRQGYGKLLEKALHRKLLVLLGALALFIASIALALSRGTEFMPQMESNQIAMTLETEEGSSLDDTAKVADQVMDRIGKIEDIKDIGGLVSASDMMGTQTESNVIEFYAITKDHPSLNNEQLKKKIESVTKDIDGELTVNMSNMDMSALGSSGINIQIKGKDLDKLQKVANDVKGIVEKTKGTQNVLDGTEDNNKELRVVVDKTKATQHGLTVAQVYQQLYGKLAEAQTATTLATDTNDYDVYVLDDANESLSREDIRNLTITAEKQDGTSEDVKLSDIATFEDASGLRAISRKDQSRFMSVTAEIKDGDNIGLVSSRVKKALKFYDAPEGYEIKMTGEDETINEAMIELFKMLALAIVFMYLIMVAQFQSLRSPFIVMFTVPLAFTGGLLALWMSGMAVSVIAMIGFVMLSGIIVNNGIVFIDYTNQLIAAGIEKEKALVEAGKTRLRPIIMTALTTILGLSTMAIGFGMGADMVQPMAVVTIGGLIYGTILTLVVVPCIFDLFHKKEKARLREGIEEIETTLDQ